MKFQSINISTLLRVAAALAVVGMLSGCATASKTEAMIISPTSTAPSVSVSDKGYQAYTVESVTGGSKTNPLWASKVGNDEFKAALTASLEAKGYHAAGQGKYKIAAELVGLKQPFAGLDMTVTSQVRYSVKDASGKEVFNKLVAASGTAALGDAFVGVTRLRIANERAIQNNIEAFLAELSKLS